MRQLATEQLDSVCVDVELLSNASVNDIVKSKIQLSASRENMDDSLFLCDLGEVMIKQKTWIDVFPCVQPYYAVRCNKDKTLLQWLIAMGVGFNCANKSEMELVLELGCEASKIVFGNPCKQSSHVRYAAKHQVNLVGFDSAAELSKMKKNYPQAQLVLCMAEDDDEAADGMNMKYGVSFGDAKQLISLAHQLQLNVVGISLNVKGGSKEDDYMRAFRRARSLFDHAASLGIRFTLLDIGGEFSTSHDSFVKMGKTINGQISEVFPTPSFDDLRVIAQPGSYYAQSAFTACTNIIAKKEVTSINDDGTDATVADGDGVGFMYYINDGIYGSFNILHTENKKFVPTPLKKLASNTQQFQSNIWGPTCDGLDKVCDSAYLPQLEIGDWLVWKDMGAYSMALSSKFNGFRTKCVHYYISQHNWNELKDEVMVNRNFNPEQISHIKLGISKKMMMQLSSPQDDVDTNKTAANMGTLVRTM